MDTTTEISVCDEEKNELMPLRSLVHSNTDSSVCQSKDSECEIQFNTESLSSVMKIEDELHSSRLRHCDESIPCLKTPSNNEELLNKASSKTDSSDIFCSSYNGNFLEGSVTVLFKKTKNDSAETNAEYLSELSRKKDMLVTLSDMQDSTEDILQDSIMSVAHTYPQDSTDFVSGDQKAHDIISVEGFVQNPKLNVDAFYKNLESSYSENYLQGDPDDSKIVEDAESGEMPENLDEFEPTLQSQDSNNEFRNDQKLNWTIPECDLTYCEDSANSFCEDLIRHHLDIKLHEDSDDSETPVNSDDTDTPVNSDDSDDSTSRCGNINLDTPGSNKYDSSSTRKSDSPDSKNSESPCSSKSGSYKSLNSSHSERNSDHDSHQKSDPDTSLNSDPDTSLNSDPDSSLDSDPDSSRDSEPDSSLHSDPDSSLHSDPDSSLNSDPDGSLHSDPDSSLHSDPESPQNSDLENSRNSDLDSSRNIDPDNSSSSDTDSSSSNDTDSSSSSDPNSPRNSDLDNSRNSDLDSSRNIDPDSSRNIDPDSSSSSDSDSSSSNDTDSSSSSDTDSSSSSNPGSPRKRNPGSPRNSDPDNPRRDFFDRTDDYNLDNFETSGMQLNNVEKLKKVEMCCNRMMEKSRQIEKQNKFELNETARNNVIFRIIKTQCSTIFRRSDSNVSLNIQPIIHFSVGNSTIKAVESSENFQIAAAKESDIENKQNSMHKLNCKPATKYNEDGCIPEGTLKNKCFKNMPEHEYNLDHVEPNHKNPNSHLELDFKTDNQNVSDKYIYDTAEKLEKSSESKMSKDQNEIVDDQKSYISYQSNLISDKLQIDECDNLTQGEKLEKLLVLGKNPQEILKSFKGICDSLFLTFQSYFHSFINGTELKTSSDDIMGDFELNEPVKCSEEESLSSSTNNVEPENLNSLNFPSGSLRDITNFHTLFLHLRATAGTDVTADQVRENINGQMVLEFYNGFQELRTTEYGSVKNMEQIIRGDLYRIQNIILRSYEVCSKIKTILPRQAQTKEELEILNEDLKCLAGEVSENMGTIEELLTSLQKCNENYMQNNDWLSEDLSEFLMEDFPDIFN